MKDLVKKINDIVKSEKWFDFTVVSIDTNTVRIVGGKDLSLYYTLSIEFQDVFHVNINFDWKADMSKNHILEIVNESEAVDYNIKYKIEKGYTIFKFLSEDLPMVPFYIVAKEVSYDDRQVNWGIV